MTLEELIDQQISLGHHNPHDFYEILERQLGDELLEVVRPYIADFVAEMGRHRINNQRRAAVVKITKNNSSDKKIMLHSLWVPDNGSGITYKRIADMTVDDFEARADYLDHMARGIRCHAQWCRDVADMMRSQNVKTAGKLKELPELGNDEDLL